jgi:hypothetical protein
MAVRKEFIAWSDLQVTSQTDALSLISQANDISRFDWCYRYHALQAVMHNGTRAMLVAITADIALHLFLFRS